MKNHWVTCDEYTAGPYDEEAAQRKAEQVTRDAATGAPHICHLEHSIVISDVAPVPPWKQNLERGY
jgi:hypothetical protein